MADDTNGISAAEQHSARATSGGTGLQGATDEGVTANTYSKRTAMAQAASPTDAELARRHQRIRSALRARLGEDVFSSWFASMDFVGAEGGVLRVSVPVKFLKGWIESHFTDQLLECGRLEFKDIEQIEVRVREPAAAAGPLAAQAPLADDMRSTASVPSASSSTLAGKKPHETAANSGAPTTVNGLEGSPLDPRYTFESFVVGAANRIAHASAMQVAETVLSQERTHNPLYIHSSVGHGKTHLLQAIAWEVRRRSPSARIIYVTAERFRFQFVEALKAQDGMAFKDRFRSIDMLMVDDMEFLHGEQTELEFDHIINTLLDSGRQLVVASARAPGQLTRLNDRMRSRMQRGLAIEITAHDYDLRYKILERRVRERRAADASFEIPEEVMALLAERLTESGRELEGAITRLFATWQYTRTPITLDLVETTIRDLVNGVEPKRIRIEDIQRLVSRHYGVSKGDLLSPRRHRSIVWPRQIGMYLSKQLTTRSLPEIGRRFGNRDHTTVLHAIRKVQNEITGDNRLKDELDELSKLLNS